MTATSGDCDSHVQPFDRNTVHGARVLERPVVCGGVRGSDDEELAVSGQGRA